MAGRDDPSRATALGVAELKYDSGLLGRGQDARSPLSMVNLPVSFFPSAIQFMPKISNARP